MEFRIKNINSSLPIIIDRFIDVKESSAFIIRHNGNIYNTLIDNVMYLYGDVSRRVLDTDLFKFSSHGNNFINQSGTNLKVIIKGFEYRNCDQFGNYISHNGVFIRDLEN